jgi:O-antigen/teichoic acid export membrane protein
VPSTVPPPNASTRTSRARPLVARIRASHGVRAGALIAFATIVMNVASYLFNVACIRYLGSRVYGDIAAVLALTALVALPLGSVQFLLAREVAQVPSDQAGGLLRRWTLRAAVAAGVGLALAMAFLTLLQSAFSIDSRAALAVGLLGIVFAVLGAVLFGVLQGALRFGSLAATYALGGLAKPILVVPALLLGFGAVGALAVNSIAGLIAVLIAAWALRDLWSARAESGAPPHDRRQMVVMLVGSLAFASLTNSDILLAKYFLDDSSAGVYAAAALVGKAVLFLPAAVVTVLLPKAAVREAVGATSQGILLASAAVTLFVTLTATAILALVPERTIVWAFGGEFEESTELLGWFGLAMTAAALVNVYLSVYFAQRDAGFPLVVFGAAVAQVVGISLFHSSPLSIVMVTLVCATSVLVLHELFFPNALMRILAARRRGSTAARRDEVPPEPLLPS